MNLPASLFPSTWHWIAAVLALLVLYQSVLKAPWKRLKQGTQLNLLLGFVVGLGLTWSLKAGVKPGLNLHMLGAMVVTLTLGTRLAIIALALTLGVITINGSVEWQAWPINFILMGVLPVMIAHGIHRFVVRFLPAHFFVFIFVVGFAGSALTIMSQGMITTVAMALSGAYPTAFLINEYLPYFLLLGFAEGWLSGALITVMVVYRPEWVVAFDDRRYLWNK